MVSCSGSLIIARWRGHGDISPRRVTRLDDELRTRVLQEYVDVAVFRDVVERHAVRNVKVLRHLVRRILASPGGAFEEFETDEGWIVTLDDSEDVELETGVVHVVPAWDWLIRPV